MFDSPKRDLEPNRKPLSLRDWPDYMGSDNRYAQSATTKHTDVNSAARETAIRWDKTFFVLWNLQPLFDTEMSIGRDDEALLTKRRGIEVFWFQRDQITLTPLQYPMAGDCSGVTDSPSIMFITVSGTLVISQHFSCQLGSFRDSISLALKTEHLWDRSKTSGPGQDQLSNQPYLLMEVANLVGEHTMFVCQETKAPLFLQQRLSAAIGDKLLHVHLPRWHSLHILWTEVRGQHGCCRMSLNRSEYRNELKRPVEKPVSSHFNEKSTVHHWQRCMPQPSEEHFSSIVFVFSSQFQQKGLRTKIIQTCL